MSILGTVCFYDPETRQGIEAAFTKLKDNKFYCTAFAKSRTLETVGSYYKKAYSGGGWDKESKEVSNLEYIKNKYSIIEVEDGLFFERCVIFSYSNWSPEIQSAKRDTWKSYSLWYCSCNENEYSETTRLKSPCKLCKKYCSVVQAKHRPYFNWSRDTEQEKKLLDLQAKICGEMGVPRNVPVPTKAGCGLNEYRVKKSRTKYRGKKSSKQRKEFKEKKDENEMIKARGNGKNKHLSHVLKKKNRNLGSYTARYRNRKYKNLKRRRMKQSLILGVASDNCLDDRIPRKLAGKRWENI